MLLINNKQTEIMLVKSAFLQVNRFFVMLLQRSGTVVTNSLNILQRAKIIKDSLKIFLKIFKGSMKVFQKIFEDFKHLERYLWKCSGSILESKDMHAIFLKKTHKGQKGQNIGKFRQKCTKFGNILKKGRWLHVIIAQNKLLEKPLVFYKDF